MFPVPRPWSVTLLVLLVGATACSSPPEERPLEDGGTSDGGTTDGGNEPQWVEVGQAVVDAEGGPVSADQGNFSAFFPKDAFAEPTTVRVLRLDSEDGVPWWNGNVAIDAMFPLPGTTYRLEPSGRETQVPFLVSAKFRKADSPVPLANEDLGLYFHDGQSWAPASDGSVDGLGQSPTPKVMGMLSALGDVLVAIHPPYANPPELDAIRVNNVLVSDRSGPVNPTAHGGLVGFYGSGFGWDASQVQLLVDGTEVEISTVSNRFIEAAPHWGEEQISSRTRSVQVRVRGASSNTLGMRVHGAGACAGEISEVWPTAAAPGMTLQLDGVVCGTAESRRVLLGDVALVPTATGGGRFQVVIPPGTPPGPTTLRLLDWEGAAPGPAAVFEVLPVGPIVLSAGKEAGGVRLVDTRGEDHYLALEVSNLEPQPLWDSVVGLEARVQAVGLDTGWQGRLDGAHGGCFGLPSGSCALPIPASLLAQVPAGESLTVTLRALRYVGDNVPGRIHVRESNPLTLVVAQRAPRGSYTWVNLGSDESRTAFCSPYEFPLSAGDHLCVYAPGDGDPTQTDACRRRTHVLSSELLGGSLAFSSCGLQTRCLPVDEPGTYSIVNQTLGRTCTFEVKRAAGKGSSTVYVDPAAGAVLAAGGGRVTIPPGALPPLAGGGTYRVDFYSSYEPKTSETDPQRSWGTTFGLHLEPDTDRLHAPVSFTMPVDAPQPGGGKSEFGFIDPDTDYISLVKKGIAAVGEYLHWTLPAGRYAPTSPPGEPPPVMSLSFGTVTRKMGVIRFKDRPGTIEDPQARVRVEYVVDPTSEDYVSDAYAEAVLDAAVEGYQLLADTKGWRRPDYTIVVLVRKKVSWADFSGFASGATTSGYLGQAQSCIKSTLPDLDEVRYVTLHEIAHVFQREYTTNLRLSWLDEAMSEWTAFTAMGTAFQPRGLMYEGAGALVPTIGLLDSWQGYPDLLVYGTSSFLIWMAKEFGDQKVRELYEELDGSPTNWWSVHWALEKVLGLDAFILADRFAEAFWTQSFPPVEGLTLSTMLDIYGGVKPTSFTTASSLSLALKERPALSSVRYAVRVPDAVAEAATGGNLMLRATGLGDYRKLTVLHQPDLAPELGGATPVTTLDATLPMELRTELMAGTYWVIDNHTDDAKGSPATLRFELPRLHSATPSPAGKNDYVRIAGADLGTTPGTLSVGGQDVTPSSWDYNHVYFVMPDFPNTSSVSLVARTAEGARTNEIFLPVRQTP